MIWKLSIAPDGDRFAVDIRRASAVGITDEAGRIVAVKEGSAHFPVDVSEVSISERDLERNLGKVWFFTSKETAYNRAEDALTALGKAVGHRHTAILQMLSDLRNRRNKEQL